MARQLAQMRIENLAKALIIGTKSDTILCYPFSAWSSYRWKLEQERDFKGSVKQTAMFMTELWRLIETGIEEFFLMAEHSGTLDLFFDFFRTQLV